MNIDSASVGELIGVIGGLGLAASALVDTSKIGKHGGVSNSGFSAIENAIKVFFPGEKLPEKDAITRPQPLADALLQILHAHWVNGLPLADQKAIAKSLIKLRLTPETAGHLAKVTAVDPTAFAEVAKRMTTGAALEAEHTNALGRFDLALTAILDAAYQRADQRYRNVSKVLASAVAIVLAGVGGYIADPALHDNFFSVHLLLYLLCGILAVPLAPIAKDLTSALSAGVKVVQTLRR